MDRGETVANRDSRRQKNTKQSWRDRKRVYDRENPPKRFSPHRWGEKWTQHTGAKKDTCKLTTSVGSVGGG